MVTYLALFGLCVVFLELFIRTGIVADALAVLTKSREAMVVMASSDLDDDTKEATVRAGSISIMKGTLRMAAKFVVILLVLYGLYRIVAALSPSTGSELPAMLVAPVPILLMTIATVAYAWIRSRVVGRA